MKSSVYSLQFSVYQNSILWLFAFYDILNTGEGVVNVKERKVWVYGTLDEACSTAITQKRAILSRRVDKFLISYPSFIK